MGGGQSRQTRGTVDVKLQNIEQDGGYKQTLIANARNAIDIGNALVTLFQT